jgi:hypothetical protein
MTDQQLWRELWDWKQRALTVARAQQVTSSFSFVGASLFVRARPMTMRKTRGVRGGVRSHERVEAGLSRDRRVEVEVSSESAPGAPGSPTGPASSPSGGA